MRRVELVHNGNTSTLVTITPSRVTIKFKDGLSTEEETRIQTFVLKVAKETEQIPMSLRGTLQKTLAGNYSISIKSGKTRYRYSELSFLKGENFEAQ